MEIIFRADGDSVTGLGHIMRSSALMQMLQPTFDCSFYTKDGSFFPYSDFIARQNVKEFKYDYHLEAKELIAQIPPASIVVLDGYQFNTAYQVELKKAGHGVVCIDDIISFHFVADMIINHAGGVKASDYSAEGYTTFCLGPSFALVKPLFFSGPSHKNIAEKTLLVSLGGADPANNTVTVMKAVAQMNYERIDVAVGPANKNVDAIHHLSSTLRNTNVHHSLSSGEMFGLMCNASHAVLSPSTVCYEFMSTNGVVFLYQIAENQQRIKEYFLKEQLAFSFNEINNVSEAEMISSVKKQKEVFDGKSAERFLSAFTSLANKIKA